MIIEAKRNHVTINTLRKLVELIWPGRRAAVSFTHVYRNHTGIKLYSMTGKNPIPAPEMAQKLVNIIASQHGCAVELKFFNANNNIQSN